MNTIAAIMDGIILATIGQVSWKLGMNQAWQSKGPNAATLSVVLLNPHVLLGFLMYGLSTVFWLIALSKKDLSFVYPFVSLTYVLVLLMSNLVLKESIGINRLVGTFIITIGIIIISRY